MLLFLFIAGVIGFLPSVDANVQLVRRLMSRVRRSPLAHSGATVSLTPPRKTADDFAYDGLSGPVALHMAASSPLHTITYKSAPDSYEAGLGQPTPWDDQARGGFPVYPGGL